VNRPPSLIAKRLGPEQAERLSAIAGGTQLTIPDSLTPRLDIRQPLRERLGDDLFALLVFHFPGARLYVPQCRTDTAPHRNKGIDQAEVARLTKRGWSVSRIARKLGCSDRTVSTKRANLRSRARSSQPKIGE
jgi:hypothetical protein